MRADRDTRSGGSTRPDARRRLPADPMIGRVLDARYEITDRIARGGMASVYEAHDLRLDRTVAVKVMHPGMGDDEAFASRFVREARAAAKLSHPNVVAVYDQGEDDGAVFLAMELVRGHTLRDTIAREAPMRPARALSLLEPVLAALAAAHRAGLVHRDIKPENVLISEETDGPTRVKVADFGLARAVTAETQHTSTGVLIGTVSYIAPELVIEGRADARADVYSVGVLLFELLTGRKPHAGETPIQVAYKHVHDDVPPPSHEVPGIPPYVDALVARATARATARDRDLRPADAGVLLHQVRRVANALAAGLADDPELTADLALPVHPAEEETEAYDVADWVRETDHEPTTAMRTAPPTRAAAPPVTPGGPAGPPVPRRPRRRRTGLVLRLVLALVLVAALAVGGWWLFEGRYTRTPALVGLTKAAATTRLHHAGLEAKVATAYSDTVPKGQVISSDPDREGKVLDGGTVTITVSRGVEEYAVPKLAGRSLDDAEQALATIKLEVGGPRKRWSETVPEGSVIRTTPKAGTVLRPGHTVTLYVSKGRQPITIGDWEHRDAAKAKATLEKRGLKVDLDYDYDDDVAKGDVVSQSPGAGTTLHRRDTVSLIVSKGPHLVVVPDVRGSGQGSATDELEKAGFKVEVDHYTPYFGLGFVMGQDHAGDKLPFGSTIHIYVS
ncbi:Stk1 family PASTA domain-containing Ser/Thr kinase [Nocardioides sp. DS6]|uniref:non-specific serine/threonine protein kinase n=1 Tax=Nocardioides eburneus TaxID=3231482 RepID=A0ABV3SZL7_9ACTN